MPRWRVDTGVRSAVDEASWWDVAGRCPWATFYHTPLWHRLVAAAYADVADATIALTLADGETAILPLLDQPLARTPLRFRLSTFAGCYGGPIAARPLTQTEMTELARAACAWPAGRVQIVGSPLAPAHAPPGDGGVIAKSTLMLPLHADWDAVAVRFSESHRRNIAKARRQGVTTRPASTLDDYRAYYAAYEDSLRRWGASANRYPWELFAAGFELERQHPQNLTLWLAEAEGRVIAGAWVFYWAGHASYWHGAAYEDALHLNPGHVLHADIIRDAIDRGCAVYDFNPSGAHSGAETFKQRFGPEPVAVWRWRWQHPIVRGVARLAGRGWE